MEENKDLKSLIDSFNELDVSPQLTRDYVIDLQKSNNNLFKIKKPKKELPNNTLTEEDINALREEALQRKLAINRAISSTALRPSKELKDINEIGKLKSRNSLLSLKKLPKSKKENIKKEPYKNNKRKIGLGSLTNVVKNELKTEDAQKNYENDNFERKESSYLITESGKINKDVLYEVLKNAWDYYLLSKKERKDEKDDSLEDDQDFGPILGFSFKKIKSMLKGIKTKVADKLAKLKNVIIKTFNKFIKGIKSIFKKPILVLKNVFNKIKELFGKFNNIIQEFKSGLSKIKTLLKKPIEILKGVGDKLKVFGSKLLNFLKSGLSKIKGVIKGASELLQKGGKAASSGLKGVSNVLSKVKGLTKVGAKIAPTLKALGRFTGPLSLAFVALDTYDFIKNFVDKGASDSMGDIEKEAKEKTVTDNLVNLLNPFKFGANVEALTNKALISVFGERKKANSVEPIDVNDIPLSNDDLAYTNKILNIKYVNDNELAKEKIMNDDLSPIVPEEIKKPNYRIVENKDNKEFNNTSILNQEVKSFKYDEDERPIYGLVYG